MIIRVYAHKSEPLSKAFLQVVGLSDTMFAEVADQESADLVLLTGADDLRSLYNEKQLFCVLKIPEHNIARNQPENVCVVHSLRLFVCNEGIAKLLETIEKRIVNRVEKPKVEEGLQDFTDIPIFWKYHSVLVIDDTERNLRIAELVLRGHSVTTVGGLQEAMVAVGQKSFDAVLTDMEMSPDKHYPSLNPDHYAANEKIPYGFAVVLEMTARGIPVAVVTDGNHHEGWVSAMFDQIKSATVNGQKVLFFNGIGKRWDKALKRLMEG